MFVYSPHPNARGTNLQRTCALLTTKVYSPEIRNLQSFFKNLYLLYGGRGLQVRERGAREAWTSLASGKDATDTPCTGYFAHPPPGIMTDHSTIRALSVLPNLLSAELRLSSCIARVQRAHQLARRVLQFPTWVLLSWVESPLPRQFTAVQASTESKSKYRHKLRRP